ncbi:AbrB/MazE/SpoVT family DNA-binding domain-containing protein [Variovorax sp. KK3]|uniref:AbrB/MazE/SpoVT family DNA-binding domain-containing protein n=1 Tax=Variovorax sp. KK3 TaxID=1855728 RepID=UPI00097BC140|nr:AbrB/MazE/SpoVT family DNA-binding domain-containing protein [Variovorax sp. KK3]
METTLKAKGQMTLPSAARAQLGLKAGDRLQVTVVDTETIVLKRLPSPPVRGLRGLLAQPARARSLEEADAAIADHLREKQRVGMKK